MKEKLKEILSNYFFTGYIVAQNVSYLKGLLIIAVTLINLIGGHENEFSYLTILQIVYFYAYPAIVTLVLYYFRKRLDDPKIRDRIGHLYPGVHLKRNKWTIYLYPCFIARRLAFIMIPIIFYGYPYFQVQFFLAL